MSKVHRLFTWVSVLMIASLLLAACAPQPTAAPEEEQPAVQPTEAPAVEEPTEAPAEPPAEGEKKVATFIWTQEFHTLNPLYTQMWFVTVLFPVYMCQAWWYDDQTNPIPNLVTEIPSAENGGISEDGRTISLNLPDHIVWSKSE